MNKAGWVVWLALSAAILASCSFQDIVVRRTTFSVEPPPPYNPHPDCGKCHAVSQPKGKEAFFPPGVDPSKVCLDCHDYAVNHHPVNIVPAKPVNPVFPLYDGKMTCLTCHEIHGGMSGREVSPLLRGGPYKERREVCFSCHTHEEYAHVDPHIMLTEGGNHRIVNGKAVCLTCHELEPDPTKARANSVLFKADVAFLCWRCHTSMHSGFFEKHFLKKPPQEIQENMNTTAVQRKFTLPLVPRGRITCSTCHNPHQKGVLLFEEAAAGEDSLHRLRDFNVCTGCHR